MFQLAADQGIPEAAVRAIVERLGGEGISGKNCYLGSNAGSTPHNVNSAAAVTKLRFETARREAERLFKLGRIADAASPFMDAFEREEHAEQERQQESRRRRLRLLEEAIRFDELALNSDGAIKNCG